MIYRFIGVLFSRQKYRILPKWANKKRCFSRAALEALAAKFPCFSLDPDELLCNIYSNNS